MPGDHQGPVVDVTGVQVPRSRPNSGQSWNDGWFAGGGFEYMVHKGALVDVVLRRRISALSIVRSSAPSTITAGLQRVDDFDQDAVAIIVRARLTIKTQGYGWWGK